LGRRRFAVEPDDLPARYIVGVRTIIELSRGFLLIAVFCYIAAVVMALPLGVPGIVPEEWCLVPLGAGAIALGLGMIGEVADR
jgi:uncharacterized oligopeptide transporter (OPT) family protein